VIVGHWEDESTRVKIGKWTRVAAGWHVLQNTKVARIGDNMREVAVTEGDKVEAQMRLGFSVNGFGLGDVVNFVDAITEKETNQLVREYAEEYIIEDSVLSSQSLKDAVCISLLIRISSRAFAESLLV